MTQEKLSEKYVKSFLYEHGYIFDGKFEYSKNNITLEDFDGYFYFIKFSALKWNIELNEKIGRLYKPMRFSTKNPYTINNICRWVVLNKKPFEFIRGDYFGNEEKSLYFKCDKCEQVWDTNWGIIFMGCGCPFCGNIRVGNNTLGKDRPDLVDEWNYSKNGNITPYDVRPLSNKSVWWVCKKGHEWKIEISNRNGKLPRNRTNCPVCNFSKGERKINNFLLENNIKFITQKRFLNCKNKKPLPFDFYLPEINTLVEYDGQQHFYPVRFGNISEDDSIDNLVTVRKNDEIKRMFCEKERINLVRISYCDFDNIDDILKNVFNL